MTIENAVSHIGALETGLDGDARHGAGSRRDRAQIATHAIGIVGMSDAEADRLFAEFYWYMLQPNAEYRHKWQKGDIVLWDNRCTVHSAAGGYSADERRIHWRTTNMQ